LPPHTLHHADDLAGVRIDDGHQFFDREIAVPLQLGRKLFRFRWQSRKRDVGGDDNIQRNLKINIGQRLGRLPGNDLAYLVLLIHR
jgi:hypothetical protein